MNNPSAAAGAVLSNTRLLTTLERLLAIQGVDVRQALNQASQLVNESLRADKSEVFLYHPTVDTLVSEGISDTAMARQQIALGLDRLAVSNGGKTVRVFQTGETYHTGHLEDDPDELRGMTQALNIRSVVVVALDINGTRRGALQVDSAQPDRFTVEDVRFAEAVTHWIGLVLHRTELVAQVAQAAAEQARQLAAAELITILAHDLRAPLVALKGRTLMLQLRAQRERHQANLADATAMGRAAERLERMIADLMDTARLEQGLFTLTPIVIDLVALVRDTTTTLETQNGEIEVRAPDELPVEADPQRIRQVLENLLTNARKYSPDGVPVVVEVGTETNAERTWAVVTVQDAGPGIAPDVLPTLFSRFAAGRGTTGLGLGLYLARGIANAHGGTLTVTSPPEEGATFRLALPVAAP